MEVTIPRYLTTVLDITVYDKSLVMQVPLTAVDTFYKCILEGFLQM